MNNSEYTIKKLQPANNLPFNLLLLADETIDAIEKYIYDSDVYVLISKKSAEPIAVFVLYRISNAEIELKNIAVSEGLQGKGIGSYLMRQIKEIAKQENVQSLLVGTPDCAYQQIKFYEQHGFVTYSVKKDFFVENYAEPIIENGIRLIDMVLLKFIF
ncbi:GNAT family N-acetyltransferase [Spirosoma harenae]